MVPSHLCLIGFQSEGPAWSRTSRPRLHQWAGHRMWEKGGTSHPLTVPPDSKMSQMQSHCFSFAEGSLPLDIQAAGQSRQGVGHVRKASSLPVPFPNTTQDQIHSIFKGPDPDLAARASERAGSPPSDNAPLLGLGPEGSFSAPWT